MYIFNQAPREGRNERDHPSQHRPKKDPNRMELPFTQGEERSQARDRQTDRKREREREENKGEGGSKGDHISNSFFLKGTKY